MQTELSDQLVQALQSAKPYDFNRKAKVLQLAIWLLAETDEPDPNVGKAVDFLQCQVEHKENQDRLMSAIDQNRRFGAEFGDLRHLVHELRGTLMDEVRYGKRSPALDEVLQQLTTLIGIAQAGPPQQIGFVGVEEALSPRCQFCEPGCRSAFREIQTYLRRQIRFRDLTTDGD